MIHQEGVFTCATKEACRLADTVTQITAGGESSLKPIRFSKAGVSFTFGLEDLPDLENIITGVTEYICNSRIIIKHEIVRSVAAIDCQPAVNITIVINTLDLTGLDIFIIDSDGCKHTFTEQEAIVLIGAIHVQIILTIARIGDNFSALVVDIDQR